MQRACDGAGDAGGPVEPPPQRVRTSDLLAAMAAEPGEERMSLGQMMDRLGERAFGILILLFALPNCIPGPPGLSTVTGIPILVLALQMLAGSAQPRLPEYLRNRSLSRKDFRALMGRAIPVIRRVERLTRPRLTMLVGRRAEQPIGALLLVFSIVLILPIPLGNLFPAVAIAIMALALMEQDGVVLVVGIVAGIAATIVAMTVLIAIVAVVLEGFSRAIG